MVNNSSQQCSFCERKVEQVQEIIRTDNIRIIYPKAPIIEENLLFVPIRHVERVDNLSDDEMVGLLQVIRKVKKCFNNLYGTSGFNLFVNDGQKAGQHVPHVHFHFFGRSENEKISPYKVLNNPDLYKIEKLSNEEIKNRVDKIKKELLRHE